MDRFQHPDAGPDNRFRSYGGEDSDIDANDAEERCETCGQEISKCECGKEGEL